MTDRTTNWRERCDECHVDGHSREPEEWGLDRLEFASVAVVVFVMAITFPLWHPLLYCYVKVKKWRSAPDDQ